MRKRAVAGHLRAVMDDAVMSALLTAMADALVKEELSPDESFALFVDWRDGRPRSYLSNIPRPRALSILDEWLSCTKNLPDRAGSTVQRGQTPLSVKCTRLGIEMVEEDIDVVLLLVTWGDSGEVAYFSSMDGGRAVVEEWVRSEKRQSS